MIGGYKPLAICPEAAAFARWVVAEAAPPSVSRAKAWLFAAGRLGAFALSVGMDLEPAVVLSEPVIERFTLAWWRPGEPGATAATVRSQLKALAGRRGPVPPPVPIARARAKRPYTAAEIAGYLRLADAQASESRRMRASGLICLGAGAGLIGVDLRAVTGTDIVARSGGLVVAVGGRRTRVVPVLAAYHHRVGEVAGFFGDRLVIGGVDPARRNVTTPLIASLSGGGDLPRLEVGRLRSTWLATVAETIGLRALLDAAGIACPQRLGDIAAHLPPLDETTAVGLLGGRPRP